MAAAAPVLIAAAPAVISAAGSITGGVMAMNQANYQAQVAKNNAKVAEYNAARSTVRGGIEAQLKDVEFSQLIGEQTSQQAASGVAVSGRSALRARNATRLAAAGDRMTIRENSNVEGYNYLVDATNMKAEAKALRKEGKAALVGSLFDAAGTLASAAAGGKFGKSLVGGAASTAKAPIPRMRPTPSAPIPRPRPPSIGYNPLMRSRYNMGH